MTDSTLNPNRPDPIMSVEGAFFWKAADKGRFVVQKCGGCGMLHHPPRAICPECLSFEKEEAELSGRGTVVSWVMPIHPTAFGFDVPPIVALIELEEGVRLVSNVEGADPKIMKVGLPVKVAFAKTRGGHKLPIFHPA
jgi:uncharacterized OB-fold protein